MSQKDSQEISKLLEQIALSRSRMQNLWVAKGCIDSEVLAASIELDELLNRYDLLRPPKI